MFLLADARSITLRAWRFSSARRELATFAQFAFRRLTAFSTTLPTAQLYWLHLSRMDIQSHAQQPQWKTRTRGARTFHVSTILSTFFFTAQATRRNGISFSQSIGANTPFRGLAFRYTKHKMCVKQNKLLSYCHINYQLYIRDSSQPRYKIKNELAPASWPRQSPGMNKKKSEKN